MPVKIEDAFMIGDKSVKDIAEYSSLGNFISAVLPNIYIISGLILFILIIIAGFGIMTSSGDKEKAAKSRKALTAAVIGFAVVFGSYWLIQIIEFITGINIFNPGV